MQLLKGLKAKKKPSSMPTHVLKRSCSDCPKKRKLLQRRVVSQSEPEAVPPIVHEVLRSPGRPLDTTTCSFMESRFSHDFSRVRSHAAPQASSLTIGPAGDSYEQEADRVADKAIKRSPTLSAKKSVPSTSHDFSNVRVHNDSKAAESAQKVNAFAYTFGHDIVFAEGQFQPLTVEGKRLIAHELTHVVQQKAANPASLISKPLQRSHEDGFEQEARLAADKLDLEGPIGDLSLSSMSRPAIQCYSWDEFVEDAGDVASSAGDAASSVVDVVSEGASAAGQTMADAGEAAMNAVEETGEAIGQGVASGAEEVAQVVETVGEAVAGGAEAAWNAAVETVSSVGQEVGSVESDVEATISQDIEETRNNLIARVNATIQMAQSADPDMIIADESQIASLNQHISSLNAIMPSTTVPFVPVLAPIGPAAAKVLGAIGKALLGATAAVILSSLIIIIAILLLFGIFFRGDSSSGERSRQSKPINPPSGTKPIDKSNLDREDIHKIKDRIGARPKDWVGIDPDGDVITSDEEGDAVNHGPASDYL